MSYSLSDLIHLLVSERGEAVHLRSNEPPVLEIKRVLHRVEGPPLSPEEPMVLHKAFKVHTTTKYKMDMRATLEIGALFLLALTMGAADSTEPPFLQMRWVAEQPTEEAEKMILVHKRNGETYKQELYAEQNVLFDETDLEEANVTQNPVSDRFQIEIIFEEEAAKRFAKETRENTGRVLAIVIGGELISAPRVNEEIPGGRAAISGNFDELEAKALAKKLNEARKR